MKKFLSLFLIISILIGMFPIVKAAGANNITLTATPSTVSVGDTVTVTLKTVEKIQSTDFTLKYTRSVLEFTSTSIDEDYYNPETAGEVKVCFVKASGSDTFTFTFKVIAEGTATVSTDIEAMNLDTSTPYEFENKSVTITAQQAGGDSEDDNIEVTSVTLNRTEATLKVGEKTTLTATVLPSNATNKTVTWSSNNENVATVLNGTVTAIKAGTATITAKAGDKTATCTVIVTEEASGDDDKEDEKTDNEVTSIKLNKTSTTLKVGEKTTLTATVLPNNAVDKTVTWSSNNEDVATVSNGTVTAIKTGTATITATAGNKTATCTITVTNSSSNSNNSNSSNNDGTTAKDPIPQTGETVIIAVSVLSLIVVAIISIIKYRKYRDI